jgi:hypothetical protein
MFLQTTVQDRIIEVVRRVGGKTATSLTGIDMTPSGEPNRLRDALAWIFHRGGGLVPRTTVLLF